MRFVVKEERDASEIVDDERTAHGGGGWNDDCSSGIEGESVAGITKIEYSKMLEFETVERGGVDGDCECSAEIKYEEGQWWKRRRRVYSMKPSSEVKSWWLRRRVFLKSWFRRRQEQQKQRTQARYLGVIVLPPWVALAVRPRPGIWEYLRVNVHALVVENLQPAEFLKFKEELVDGR